MSYICDLALQDQNMLMFEDYQGRFIKEYFDEATTKVGKNS